MDWQPTILSGGESRSDDQIMAAHEPKAARRVSGPGLTGGDGEPLVIMELLQRLRVKDVMRNHDIISVVRTDTMHFAQNLMKRNHISGVPVLEGKRLFGIVSINDIILALEGGWIGDPCQKHMATNLVVLEEDMPLAFAIKYFQNYTFGRFPVLDTNRDLVGIVSQRDVMRVLMRELTSGMPSVSATWHIVCGSGFALCTTTHIAPTMFAVRIAWSEASDVKRSMSSPSFRRTSLMRSLATTVPTARSESPPATSVPSRVFTISAIFMSCSIPNRGDFCYNGRP